jgi:hypothetical protein
MIRHDLSVLSVTRMVSEQGSFVHCSLGTAFSVFQAGIGASASEKERLTLVWKSCLLALLKTDSSAAECRSVPVGLAWQRRSGVVSKHNVMRASPTPGAFSTMAPMRISERDYRSGRASELLIDLDVRCPTNMTAYFYNHPLQNADLIFVLAGRENRKQFGLDLFNQGLAPRILFSVARFEIRRFSKLSLPVPLDLVEVAADVPPPQRHYFVLFERRRIHVEHIRPGRFGTLTEIEALGRWLEGHPNTHSLLIVSSDTHLRRIRMCCRSLLGASIRIELIAAPDGSSGERESESVTATLVEMLKTFLYWAILGLRRDWLR